MGKSTLKIHKVDLSTAPLEFKWYTVKVNYNYERQAERNIRNNLAARGYGEYIDQIILPLIPVITTTVNKKGEKKEKTKWEKIYGYDGYIWVRMILNSDTWFAVRNSTGVMGWGESNGRPLAMTDLEMINIKQVCGLIEVERKVATDNFKGQMGDLMKIMDGTWSGFEGTITEINQEDKWVKIVMPNNMTVKAEFYQVEKV